MKNDIATSILVAILGIVISFVVCNTFFGEIPPYSFSSIQDPVSAELTDPDVDIFNYRALNPTVEVYVGDCANSDDYEKCVNDSSSEGQIDQDIVNQYQEGEASGSESNTDSSTNQREQ